MFTSKDVMELRKKTGAGVADCQKALKETDGNMDKAVDFLREKGIATAAKKASRIAAEGIVASLIKGDTVLRKSLVKLLIIVANTVLSRNYILDLCFIGRFIYSFSVADLKNAP